MTCNLRLRLNGAAYPRTCEDCGLGPCTTKFQLPEPHKFESSTRRSDVPDISYDLTYVGQGYSAATTCSECGGLVRNEDLHTAWHTKLVRGNND